LAYHWNVQDDIADIKPTCEDKRSERKRTARMGREKVQPNKLIELFKLVPAMKRSRFLDSIYLE
jgi:hypothetical protein